MEDNSMNNEYTTSEVIEIGKAQELILGVKTPAEPADIQFQRLEQSDNDLDD
jgi:hypothetical protein